MHWLCCLLLVAFWTVGTSNVAKAFSIATWNVSSGTIENVSQRREDFEKLASALRKENSGDLPDVLVLQEVTSLAAAKVVADGLGYTDATVAISDFDSDDEFWAFTLEVAIITKRKVTSIDGYQTQRKNEFGKPVPLRAPLAVHQSGKAVPKGNTSLISIPKIKGIESKTIARGVLRAELKGKVVVYGVHLKSSRLTTCRPEFAIDDSWQLWNLANQYGLSKHADAIKDAWDAVKQYRDDISDKGVPATVNEARKSARNREATAAAIAEMARIDFDKGKSVYVAGDFNTPVNEPCKTGVKLVPDNEPEIGCNKGVVADTCGAKDGFDDTIAIFDRGLTGGPDFEVLTKDLKKTYVKSGFINSPIDNIVVAGPDSSKSFTVKRIDGKLDKKRKLFGSDHHAILAFF